jgi:hypothetical protein
MGIVKPGPHFTGEQKGPPQAYGPDGIQFVGIEEDTGLQCGRRLGPAEAVAADAVPNPLPHRSGDIQVLQDINGLFGADPGMTDPASGGSFFLPADIMEQGRQGQYGQIRLFLFPHEQTEIEHPPYMIPTVAPGGFSHRLPGPGLDLPPFFFRQLYFGSFLHNVIFLTKNRRFQGPPANNFLIN